MPQLFLSSLREPLGQASQILNGETLIWGRILSPFSVSALSTHGLPGSAGAYPLEQIGGQPVAGLTQPNMLNFDWSIHCGRRKTHTCKPHRWAEIQTLILRSARRPCVTTAPLYPEREPRESQSAVWPPSIVFQKTAPSSTGLQKDHKAGFCQLLAHGCKRDGTENGNKCLNVVAQKKSAAILLVSGAAQWGGGRWVCLK